MSAAIGWDGMASCGIHGADTPGQRCELEELRKRLRDERDES